MKRKAIEKIPYLTAPKCSKKSIGYVAAVAIERVDRERHLFLEIYENKKLTLQIPVYRFVYTKRDWGNYHPEREKWSACKIENDYGYPIWDKTYDAEKNIYISEKDIQKIKDFAQTESWNKKKWWDYLVRLESNIKHNRWKVGMDKREKKIKERHQNVPALPDTFEDWYKDTLFKDINFIYYKRKGRYATFYCSHCGKRYTYATKQLDTFEGQFETVIETPRAGNKARCGLCNAVGIYKTTGTMKTVYGLTKMCYIGQPYKRTGALIRYIQVEKIFAIGRPEKYIVTEIARNFYERDKKPITDYQLYSGWSGKTEWHDHNVGGMGKQISQEPAAVFPGTFEGLKGTVLQYTGLQEYMKEYETVQAARYMDRYFQFPCIEMFSKAGMYHLVKEMVEGYHMGYLRNSAADNPADLLGIKKEKLKILIKTQGNTELLSALQTERFMGASWTEDQCRKLADIKPDYQKLELALVYMSVQQLLNRVEKYAGAQFEGACTHAIERLRHVSTTYLDYLQMRRRQGYDLNNSVYCYPRDISAAHANMVLEINEKELDKRLKEVSEKYPEIRKHYRGWRNRYFHEDESFMIRPARSAEEIVIEGRELHHCVGGDNFLQDHNEGKSIILVLRFKDMPEIPYITVEIEDTRIHQWYGKGDKKPDQENMQKWLDNYVMELKSREIETDKAAGQRIRQPVTIPA